MQFIHGFHDSFSFLSSLNLPLEALGVFTTWCILCLDSSVYHACNQLTFPCLFLVFPCLFLRLKFISSLDALECKMQTEASTCPGQNDGAETLLP